MYHKKGDLSKEVRKLLGEKVLGIIYRVNGHISENVRCFFGYTSLFFVEAYIAFGNHKKTRGFCLVRAPDHIVVKFYCTAH